MYARARGHTLRGVRVGGVILGHCNVGEQGGDQSLNLGGHGGKGQVTEGHIFGREGQERPFLQGQVAVEGGGTAPEQACWGPSASSGAKFFFF